MGVGLWWQCNKCCKTALWWIVPHSGKWLYKICKSLCLLGVPSLLAVYLTEVTYCPCILESLTEFFSLFSVSESLSSFSVPLLDLRGNFKTVLLLITVVVPPFINLLLVLDSEASSDHGASVPKQRWWCFRELQHRVFGKRLMDLLTNLELVVITVIGLILSHWRWTRSWMRWYICSSEINYLSLLRRVNAILLVWLKKTLWLWVWEFKLKMILLLICKCKTEQLSECWSSAAEEQKSNVRFCIVVLWIALQCCCFFFALWSCRVLQLVEPLRIGILSRQIWADLRQRTCLSLEDPGRQCMDVKHG